MYSKARCFIQTPLMMYSNLAILSKPADVSKNSLFYPNTAEVLKACCFIQIPIFLSNIQIFYLNPANVL